MEKYMAGFGQGFVQASVLSENNAVKYRLTASGSCTKSSVRPYIKFQDVSLPIVVRPGMNVYVFNTETNVIEETKNYFFTTTSSSANRAFMTYMASLPAERLVIMLSEGKLNTDSELIAWFSKANSLAWLKAWQPAKFDAAYTAFYITSQASVTAEHILFNDGKTTEAVEPLLDLVYDYYADIGATGFPKTIGVLDGTIMSSGTTLGLIRMPTTDLITPLSNYSLKEDDVIYMKFQLYLNTLDSGGIPAGTTRMSCRFYNGTALVKDETISAPIDKLDQWISYERDITIPAGANGFTIYFARTNSADIAGVRNVVVTEVARDEYPLFRAAEFGVNGIRANKMSEFVGAVDGDLLPEDELLILKNTDADMRGIVRSHEFREI